MIVSEAHWREISFDLIDSKKFIKLYELRVAAGNRGLDKTVLTR